MLFRSVPKRVFDVLTILIGSVWIFHGLYSKILNGIPRHRAIVGRILGEEWATPVTMAVGVLEVMLGLWAWSRWRRRHCALAQTLAIVAMNALEIARARDLLLSAAGMLLLNAVFLCGVWVWALAREPEAETLRN